MRVLIVEVGLNYEFIFNNGAIITSFRKLTAHLGSAIFLQKPFYYKTLYNIMYTWLWQVIYCFSCKLFIASNSQKMFPVKSVFI